VEEQERMRNGFYAQAKAEAEMTQGFADNPALAKALAVTLAGFVLTPFTEGLSDAWALGEDAAILESMDASTIRFTQDSIKSAFRNGNSLSDTIAELKAGNLTADDFPAIRVFERDGNTYSLDNRRLYVFQEAGTSINTIPATEEEIASSLGDKFTTKNDGISIRVR
jgi:hypothetical protein